MKRVKSTTRRSAPKTKSSPRTIDDYIDRSPESARANLKKLRAAIRSVLPREATETISYAIPAFRYKVVLVWFAAFSDHYSLFPTAAVLSGMKDELKNYTTSKGTIHFPADKPLPIALIKKIVKTRLAQLEK